MSAMLIASSPVEIEARADQAALAADARAAALRLFHDLTSHLELTPPVLDAEGGEDWPRQRFYFGRADGEIRHLLAALRTGPQTSEVAPGGNRADDAARTLFIVGDDDDFAGVLVACADPAQMRDIATGLERAP